MFKTLARLEVWMFKTLARLEESSAFRPGGQLALNGAIAAVMRGTAHEEIQGVVVVVVVVVVAAFIAVLGLGCPAPPVATPEPCPPGQQGEPCAFPWEADCVDAAVDTGCVEGSPLRCDVDDSETLPAYDCDTCGCGAADACVVTSLGGLCLSADVREGERSALVVDDGLEDADYVALLERLHGTDARTLDQILARLQERRAADPRRSIVILGSDEVELSRIVPVFFAGSFGTVVASNSCENIGISLLPERSQVVVSAADRATEATCLHPGVFADCSFPAAAGCALLQGLLPETLVILGAKAIADVDNALLRHAARAGRDEWLARFDAELGLFSTVFLGSFEPRFAHPDLPGSLRFIIGENEEGGGGEVVFGLFENDPNPVQLRTFRLMWVNATVQQFLIEHDITPSDCAFAPDPASDGVDVDCNKNGASVSGRVLLETNDLSGLALLAP